MRSLSVGGDCDGAAVGVQVAHTACPPAWLGNGNCEVDCNNRENDFDGGDCEGSAGDDAIHQKQEAIAQRASTP